VTSSYKRRGLALLLLTTACAIPVGICVGFRSWLAPEPRGADVVFSARPSQSPFIGAESRGEAEGEVGGWLSHPAAADDHLSTVSILHRQGAVATRHRGMLVRARSDTGRLMAIVAPQARRVLAQFVDDDVLVGQVAEVSGRGVSAIAFGNCWAVARTSASSVGCVGEDSEFEASRAEYGWPLAIDTHRERVTVVFETRVLLFDRSRLERPIGVAAYDTIGPHGSVDILVTDEGRSVVFVGGGHLYTFSVVEGHLQLRSNEAYVRTFDRVADRMRVAIQTATGQRIIRVNRHGRQPDETISDGIGAALLRVGVHCDLLGNEESGVLSFRSVRTGERVPLFRVGREINSSFELAYNFDVGAQNGVVLTEAGAWWSARTLALCDTD